MEPNENPLPVAGISPRTAALVAGLGLLAMAVLAAFANFYILPTLVVPGDAAGTAANIEASAGLFRVAITCFLIVAILDIVVAWALYLVLKPANGSVALLSAWFRVVYAAIFAVAVNNLFGVLHLLTGAGYLGAFGADQVQAQVMLDLSAFRSGWDIALVFFSLHLFLLGYLVFVSGYMPKWLGILVVVSALGYLIDAFGAFLLPSYGLSIASVTFVGELVLMVWLLWKGVRGIDIRPAPG